MAIILRVYKRHNLSITVNSASTPARQRQLSGLITRDILVPWNSSTHYTGGCPLQGLTDTGKESLIGISLANIPHHHSSKTVKLLRILDNGLEVVHRHEPVGRRVFAGRNTEQDLDVLVLRSILGPLVPCLEVERVLGVRALLKRCQATRVVVELHKHGVHGDGARSVQEVFVGGIGVWALRRRGKEVLLVLFVVHQLAKALRKSIHVAVGGFKVQVKPVNGHTAKRTVNLGRRLVGPTVVARALTIRALQASISLGTSLGVSQRASLRVTLALTITLALAGALLLSVGVPLGVTLSLCGTLSLRVLVVGGILELAIALSLRRSLTSSSVGRSFRGSLRSRFGGIGCTITTGTECLPDQLSTRLRTFLGVEATLAVRRTSDGQ